MGARRDVRRSVVGQALGAACGWRPKAAQEDRGWLVVEQCPTCCRPAGLLDGRSLVGPGSDAARTLRCAICGAAHRPPGGPRMVEAVRAVAAGCDLWLRCGKCGKTDLVAHPTSVTPLTAHRRLQPADEAAAGWPSSALARGTCIGPYRIEDIAGEGGMGRVYLAVQQRPRMRRVALKLLRRDLPLDRGLIRRFRREVQILRAISHPNVVRILDAGEHEGRPYLVLPHLEGGSIVEYLRYRGCLPSREALDLFIQLCSALDACHRVGVVHRDLKPDNVFVVAGRGGAPLVKLIDFSVALDGSAVALRPAPEAPGEIVGTPRYMAPEQLLGRRTDPRADLFALGLILYAVFTNGRWPWPDPADAFVRTQMAPAPPALLMRLNPRLAELILRCLEVRPQRRPQSAVEVRRGLLLARAEWAPVDAEVASPGDAGILTVLRENAARERWRRLAPGEP